MDIEELMCLQFRVGEKNDFQKVVGGNHILNIEVIDPPDTKYLTDWSHQEVTFNGKCDY